MKSVLLTFVLFLILFGVLQLDAAKVLGSSLLPIIALIVFLLVVAVAVSFFGFPTKKDFLKALKIKSKEADDEENK